MYLSGSHICPQSKYGSSEISIAFNSRDLSMITILGPNFSAVCWDFCKSWKGLYTYKTGIIVGGYSAAVY